MIRPIFSKEIVLSVTNQPPNPFFLLHTRPVDRMRALYWLLLLLVIIGGCSGTKRKPNAPENTTNAVETDEDTWEEDLATFCSPVDPVAEAARDPRMVVLEHQLLMPPAYRSVKRNSVLG